MANDSCCEALRAHVKGNPASNGVEQAVAIVPTATETAKTLASMAVSMLGWDYTKLSPTEDAVRRYILVQYPLLGRAPSCLEIGEALGLALHDIQRILEHLHKLDILFLEPERPEIRLAYPFSTVPTRHVVKFHGWADAKPVYAQCAIDALGIPFMFDHDLVIGSSCADCSKPITIEIRNRMIVARNPAETVVWAGTTRSGHAATSVCPTINFFCSSEHAAAWLQGQASTAGSMISLAEAFYIGKEIFEPLLLAASGSTSRTRDHAQTDRPEGAALTATSLGGLVAAFLASLCCVGPLVLVALGIGVGATGFLANTAGALKALLPYRPVFIGLTTLLLGAAFYLVYRKPKAACVSGSTCVPVSGSRTNRAVLWIVAALALGLILAPYWLGL